MKYLPLIGRIFFAAIFLKSGLGHFSQGTIGYAASAGVPLANIAVPFSGLLAIVGALSILFGFKTRVGAWLLVIFLVPVTLTMHKFWGLPDPMQAQMQQVNFMKNLALTGGALFLAYFGGGPLSLDEKKSKG
jgi:putative oxidoreductase